MNPIDNRPVAAVRMEGTLCDENREPIPGALDLLKILAETHYIVIVTPLTHSAPGTKIAYEWLRSYTVPYDDLWCAPGLPAADVWYDNEAMTL